jgi:hypothetical protein
MYLRNAVKPIETAGAIPSMVALVLCVVLTLALSIPPGANWMMTAVRQTTVRPTLAHPAALNQAQP